MLTDIDKPTQVKNKEQRKYDDSKWQQKQELQCRARARKAGAKLIS